MNIRNIMLIFIAFCAQQAFTAGGDITLEITNKLGANITIDSINDKTVQIAPNDTQSFELLYIPDGIKIKKEGSTKWDTSGLDKEMSKISAANLKGPLTKAFITVSPGSDESHFTYQTTTSYRP